jgi:4-amino-4-deoxy-L-arabinose transferase-like glycosyltransferase
MDVIALLQRLAGWLGPHRVASIAILIAVLATLLPGARRRRTGRVGAAGLALLALGALPALGAWPWQINLALSVAVLALALVHLRGAPADERRDDPRRPAAAGLAVVGAATALMALFLVAELGSYTGNPLIWEGEVADGFAAAFRERLSPLAYIGRRLLWSHGVVSEGHDSLLYGGPTYPLLLHAGFSSWTLRAVACVCGLLSAPAFYLLARRWLARPAALVAAVAWAASPTVLLYSRYATSLSATLATLVLAALAVETVRTRGTRAWWPAPLAAVALAVASLHYSPARLVVLLLLVLAAGHLLAGLRRLTRTGVAGALLAAAILAVFVAVQARHDRVAVLLDAYGEHVFGILDHPEEIAAYLGRPPAGGAATLADTAALGAALVRANLPDLGRLAGVLDFRESPAAPGWRALEKDPPAIPLYFLPLLPFLTLGVAHSLRRPWEWPHGLLLAWTGITVGAVLLANRVDHHRLVTLAVPVCVWLGAGLWHGLGILRRSGLSRAAGAVLFGVLLGAALLESVWLLDPPRPVSPPLVAVAAGRAIEGAPGAITAALVGDVRDRAAVELILRERERALSVGRGRRLPQPLVEVLHDPRQRARPDAALLDYLGAAASEGTLLLGPADDTLALAGELGARGYPVRRVVGPVDLFVIVAPR